ncbi:MAG TPA: hypothetical protein VGU46_08345 [Acidobacteriaceae bacterium]|nr:hypothetical protein [Acidobacteriaceae bacterium]
MNLQTALIRSILLLIATTAIAQKAAPVPVPSQFAAAKTIFVGYAGNRTPTLPPIVGNWAYDDMERELAASGRYTLTAKPSDAELSMRLAIDRDSVLRLTIFDTKTGMLLWAFEEFMPQTTPQYVNRIAMNLVHDFETIETRIPTPAPPTPPTKTRPSHEGKK